ncbi:MAG TPA: hypothetical protein VMO47_05135, partial [Rhodothermales bacterium]|nr:hypothetical protein [Rhodothermales bacterium]
DRDGFHAGLRTGSAVYEDRQAIGGGISWLAGPGGSFVFEEPGAERGRRQTERPGYTASARPDI